MSKNRKIIAMLMVSFTMLASSPAAFAESPINRSKDGDIISNTAVTENDNNSYKNYISNYSSADYAVSDIEIDINKAYSSGNSFQQRNDNNIHYLYTASSGSINFPVDISESGLYSIEISYKAESERGTDIERGILINGTYPFDEAAKIKFSRLYQNEGSTEGTTKFDKDNSGNDIRPSQIEVDYWQTTYVYDSLHLQNDPLLFHLSSGSNIITLTAISEPLSIKSIRLVAPTDLPEYSQLSATYKENNYTLADCDTIFLQAEYADFKSSPTIFPLSDTSSPAIVPYEPYKTRLNSIGGSRWQDPGEFLIWNFEVEKSGLYTIAIKSRQNITHDAKSTRALYIDGKIPCAELKNIQFPYNRNWQQNFLSDGKEYIQLYLEKGKHELKLEVLLGDTSEKIQEVESILKELNSIYSTILMITGSSPDQMRDYQLDVLIPNEIERLGELSDELQSISEWFYAYTGGKGSNNSILDTTSRILKIMSSDHEKIPKNFSAFKTDIGSLADWIVSSRQQPLAIDYIAICGQDNDLPKANANFFEQFLYGTQRFLSSFTSDYSNMNESAGDKTVGQINVWIGSGRDQAQVLKKLISSDFIPNTNISVDLKLVSPSVFLPATVAGIGPDIALSMEDTEPVNYAIRNAVYDLTNFDDYKEISQRFLPERLVSLSYDSAVYALPETQSFNVLFYRKDILDQLGVTVPNTWDELIAIIPILLKNNLSFAMPVSSTTAPNTGVYSYFTILFQNGGNIYKNNGMRTDIDSDAGIKAFRTWTNLYKNYSLPLSYNFQNRFRTGEYPLIIADYTNFNTLAVSAPEIDGLWSFAPVPGVLKEDNTIDRSVPVTGTCCMLMNSSNSKEQAWEFMKWWTNADIQNRYGKEMESILGASARYATANIEAFKQTLWSQEHYTVLNEQLQWIRGVEQVPGGYFTTRHINNAFWQVINNGVDPKEAIYDYSYTINQELIGKRQEFGLPTE